MEMNVVFAVCGMVGGLLCAAGDILFDLKGKGNQKLGTSKNIDSNWINMSDWRFGASILCAFAGALGIALGILSLANQIIESNAVLGWTVYIMGIFFCEGGFFLHTMLCIQAVIYKGIMEKSDFETADYTLEKMYRRIMIPFVVTLLVEVATDVCVIAAILLGYLNVPKWCVLLNGVFFIFVGPIFRKIDKERFQDLPGIVMPSLGCGCLGLVSLLSLLA